MNPKMVVNYARTSTEREATLVYRVWKSVYANGGSGEPTETERLAGATPQPPQGAIPEGRTSSTAQTREGESRRVAADIVQRMGRKVHLPHNRRILPSLFASWASQRWQRPWTLP